MFNKQEVNNNKQHMKYNIREYPYFPEVKTANTF